MTGRQTAKKAPPSPAVPPTVPAPAARSTYYLPFPPSTNSLYANVSGKGRVKSKRYLTWRAVAGVEMMKQRQAKIEGPVMVEIWLERKDKRKRDLDNHAKAILDTLVEYGAIDDDRHVERIGLSWGAQRGAVVTVRPA